MTPRPVALEPFSAERGDRAAPEPEESIKVEPPGEAEPPPEPEIDPEVERRACLSRIAGTLNGISRDQEALGAQWIAAAAAAFGAAAESAVPRMARAGLAGLVAETVEKIAREARPPRLELRAAPEDTAAIGEALSAIAARPVALRPDESLAPGEVRLGWEAGGAEIDAEAIAAAALDCFARALAAKRSTEPER